MHNVLAIPAFQRIVTQDAAGAPVVSPKTGVGTGGQTFTPPVGATALVFTPSADAYYGEVSGLAQYSLAKSGVLTKLPCLCGTPIYIGAATGTITIDFHFEVLSS